MKTLAIWYETELFGKHEFPIDYEQCVYSLETTLRGSYFCPWNCVSLAQIAGNCKILCYNSKFSGACPQTTLICCTFCMFFHINWNEPHPLLEITELSATTSEHLIPLKRYCYSNLHQLLQPFWLDWLYSTEALIQSWVQLHLVQEWSKRQLSVLPQSQHLQPNVFLISLSHLREDGRIHVNIRPTKYKTIRVTKITFTVYNTRAFGIYWEIGFTSVPYDHYTSQCYYTSAESYWKLLHCKFPEYQ